MEEAAGGGPRGFRRAAIQPADRQGTDPVSRRRRVSGLQPERTPGFSARGGLQLPPVPLCSLHERAEVANDRAGLTIEPPTPSC